MSSVSLADIAKRIGGTVVGDGSRTVSGAAGLAEAGEGDLSFLANPKYVSLLANTGATAVIVARDIGGAPCALIQADNPDLAFAQAVTMLVPSPPMPPTGVHPSAVVAQDAMLGDGVAIGPCAVVESGARIGARTVIGGGCYVGCDTIVGEDCLLHPGVVLCYRVTVGSRVILHANAVVGSDGFGYVWDGSKHAKVPQVGTVIIEDDVEIGACTTVDRARFGETVIDAGTKLDNLVQIAHNVRLGRHCAFAAQSGVSGSTTVGSGVLVGGQTGIAGHLEVGDGAMISGKAGVTKSVPGGQHFSGYPARPHRAQLDEWRGVKALPRLRARLRELEERLVELESRLGEDG